MKRVLLISVLLIAFSACDKAECESQNPIFIENNPTSIAYKEELVKEISRFKESELRYWLKKYVKEGDQEYLLVYVQGEDLCAVSQIEVNEWTGRLKHIQEKKGVSYRGAEFRGFKYNIEEYPDSIAFVFKELSSIID